MKIVKKLDLFRVEEDRSGLVKKDAMLLKVEVGLVSIPLNKNHARRPLQLKRFTQMEPKTNLAIKVRNSDIAFRRPYRKVSWPLDLPMRAAVPKIIS